MLVYVHLGQTIPRELIHHAKLASLLMSEEDIYLITDSTCDPFPGIVISCKSTVWDKRFTRYLSKFPEISEADNGYWDVTIRRLLALEALVDYLETDTKIMHVESDVLLLLPPRQIINELRFFGSAAIPRLGDNGIASFLYFPSKNELSFFCEKILQTVESAKEPLTDMKILGIGLESGWLQEIPSNPFGSNETLRQVIFDGAAIGQYLFGVDPKHTEGKLFSGYKNPYFPWDLASIQWQLEPLDDHEECVLVARVGGRSVVIANLHIHSKELLPLPSLNSERWVRAIYEANGGKRMTELRAISTEVNSKISVKGKVKKARRIGLIALIRIVMNKYISRIR